MLVWDFLPANVCYFEHLPGRLSHVICKITYYRIDVSTALCFTNQVTKPKSHNKDFRINSFWQNWNNGKLTSAFEATFLRILPSTAINNKSPNIFTDDDDDNDNNNNNNIQLSAVKFQIYSRMMMMILIIIYSYQ